MKDGKTEKLKAVKRPCRAKKPDGTSCQAAALPGSDFCFFHDPARAAERREAQSFGGSRNRMKTLDASAPDVTIESCQDVVRLIGETINQVRKGQIDPRVGNAIGYLANVLIKAYEQGSLEKRIEDLEAAVKVKGRSSEFPALGMES